MRWIAVVLLAGCANGSATRSHGELIVKTLTLEHNNVHVISRGDRHVVVDAGLPATAERLDEALRAAGIVPQAVVITHAHADHAGGALRLQKQGARIIAGVGDRAEMAAGRHQPVWCPTGWLARRRLHQDHDIDFAPTAADVWVDAPLVLADVGATVVPLPGHTPGSLVVVAGDVAFVGDLFRGSIVGSSATVHFYMCDLEGNRRDIRRLLDEIAPRAQTFYLGHFGPVDRAAVEDLLED